MKGVEPEPAEPPPLTPPKLPPRGPSWWYVPIARQRGMLGGVLSGIARAHRLNTRLLRMLTVVAAFVFPLTVPLYVAAWFLLPESPKPGRSPADLVASGSRSWLAILAGITAVAVLFDGGGWQVGHGGNLAGAAILIGIGAWLWNRSDTLAGSATPPGQRPTAAAGLSYPDDGTSLRVGANQPAATEPPLPWAPGRAPWDLLDEPHGPPPPPPSPRPPVGRATLAAGLLALGVAVLGDRLGWYRLDAAEALAVLLATIGIGLVVGAFVGGGRLLILPALLLLPLTVAAARIDRLDLHGGIGERTLVAADVGEATKGYHHGVGAFSLDLRGLKWESGQLRVPVELEVGELRVTVPAGVDLDVTAHVGAGQADVLATAGSGTGVERRVTDDDPTTDRTLVLDARVGLGHLVVERAPAAGGGAR